MDIPCSVVYAGLEPIDFINLFPKWNVHSRARQQNQLVSSPLKFQSREIRFSLVLGRQEIVSERFSHRSVESVMSRTVYY